MSYDHSHPGCDFRRRPSLYEYLPSCIKSGESNSRIEMYDYNHLSNIQTGQYYPKSNSPQATEDMLEHCTVRSDDGINVSDHFAICMSLNIPVYYDMNNKSTNQAEVGSAYSKIRPIPEGT